MLQIVRKLGAAAIMLLAVVGFAAGARGQVTPGTRVPLGLNLDINEQGYVDLLASFARIQGAG